MSRNVPLQKNQWIQMRDVLRELVVRDFKVRYKRSILGIVWSLLVPVAQLAVMYVVFNQVLPLDIPHYTTFLFSGILPWTWFQTALVASSSTIVENRELIKQVGFPVAVLPAVTVLSQMIHFLLSLPILAVFLVNDGFDVGATLLALPLVIAIQFVFILSLAYIAATLQVRFRDTQYLLGVSLFLLFYLTPVFWDPSTFSGPVKAFVQVNPVAVLLAGYRSILTRQEWPAGWPLLTLALLSSLVLWMASIGFKRARDRFVEEL